MEQPLLIALSQHRLQSSQQQPRKSTILLSLKRKIKIRLPLTAHRPADHHHASVRSAFHGNILVKLWFMSLNWCESFSRFPCSPCRCQQPSPCPPNSPKVPDYPPQPDYPLIPEEDKPLPPVNDPWWNQGQHPRPMPPVNDPWNQGQHARPMPPVNDPWNQGQNARPMPPRRN